MMLFSGVTMTDEENLQHYAPTVVQILLSGMLVV